MAQRGHLIFWIQTPNPTVPIHHPIQTRWLGCVQRAGRKRSASGFAQGTPHLLGQNIGISVRSGLIALHQPSHPRFDRRGTCTETLRRGSILGRLWGPATQGNKKSISTSYYLLSF